MTKVEIFRKNGNIIGYKASGHSGYSEQGSDIICSAISTSLQMTLIGKNAETSVKPMSHKGEEIAVLLDGKVKLTIGKFSVILSSGDSIHIPAMAPHKWTNLNDTKSVIIFSVTPPEF